MLIIDQDLSDRQRTIALDLNTVLLSRANRFYTAVTALTLGPDEKIAAAARELIPPITRLLDVITASERKYARARQHAEKALAQFRAKVDQRHG